MRYLQIHLFITKTIRHQDRLLNLEFKTIAEHGLTQVPYPSLCRYSTIFSNGGAVDSGKPYTINMKQRKFYGGGDGGGDVPFNNIQFRILKFKQCFFMR